MAVKNVKEEPAVGEALRGEDSIYREEALETMAEARQRWEAATAKSFTQVPPWKRDWTMVSGMEVPHLVTPEAVADLDPQCAIGIPGEYPFTRGIHPTGYRGKLWTMRQFAGFDTAADTNRRFKYLLSQDQTVASAAAPAPPPTSRRSPASSACPSSTTSWPRCSRWWNAACPPRTCGRWPTKPSPGANPGAR